MIHNNPLAETPSCFDENVEIVYKSAYIPGSSDRHVCDVCNTEVDDDAPLLRLFFVQDWSIYGEEYTLGYVSICAACISRMLHILSHAVGPHTTKVQTEGGKSNVRGCDEAL